MSWIQDELEMLEQLKRVCVINMYIQSSSAHVYYVINNCLMIPNIVIGAIMSVSIFSTTCGKTRIVSGILAIVSTILSSLTKQVGAGERAQQHCFVVKEYSSLVREININTFLEKREIDREMFIRDVQLELDRLYMVQPEPSWLAVRKFELKYNADIDSLLFPEIERYATRVVDKTSHSPATKIENDRPTYRTSMEYRTPIGRSEGQITIQDKLKHVTDTEQKQSSNSNHSAIIDLRSPLAKRVSWKMGKINIGYGLSGASSPSISRRSTSDGTTTHANNTKNTDNVDIIVMTPFQKPITVVPEMVEAVPKTYIIERHISK